MSEDQAVTDPMVLRAVDVALLAHHGQTDRSGLPYIGHVARVAARCEGTDAITVAWLHDVLEDCEITPGMVLDRQLHSFPSHILEAVAAITRRKAEPYEPDYLARVKANPLARAVKLADLADNTDPGRSGGLTASLRRRYEHAQEFLGAVEAQRAARSPETGSSELGDTEAPPAPTGRPRAS